MVVVSFFWLYFVYSFYVAPTENFKAQAWDSISRRQLLLDRFSMVCINKRGDN